MTHHMNILVTLSLNWNNYRKLKEPFLPRPQKMQVRISTCALYMYLIHFICFGFFSKVRVNLRWLDWIFLGGYLPSLGINYVAMNKDMEKRFPQLYYIKMKILMVWVLLQSESPWQHNDTITFFIYLCVSLYQKFF